MQNTKTFTGYDTVIDLSDDDAEITHVGRGTPCGEYLRRYWQPIYLEDQLDDLPKLIKVLGEELVLFRDKSGDTGLLHKHCAHRGASLEYGIIADHGLVCCYHGWNFAVDGSLIKAGSEPENSPIHKKVVQGAYPTHEFGGIIFAYLGPTESIPAFPIFDTLEDKNLERIPFVVTTHCNWLQVFENTQDPIHVLHLHARSSGVQFGVASGVDQIIDYENTPLGMINVQTRQVEDHVWVRTTETILPNMNQGGAIWEEAESEKFFQRSAFTRWMVPVDNFETMTIGWRIFSKELDPRDQGDRKKIGVEAIDFVGQTKDERGYEESQRYPGDYEAQVSQRPIAIHKMENPAMSDRGVMKVRRLLRNQIRALKGKQEPSQYIQNGRGTISTYQQDTVVRAVLDEENKQSYSKALVKHILNSKDETEEKRRVDLELHCRELLRKLN
ncbi:MAG: aromatic ring-hydroxylating dioxygenase subunit alpha [Rhodospirillaceae bacterium]|nr:aromatic ring-hydroxylating dioxygenase subunit alpha [Rhodospirillaceae bacterium]